MGRRATKTRGFVLVAVGAIALATAAIIDAGPRPTTARAQASACLPTEARVVDASMFPGLAVDPESSVSTRDLRTWVSRGSAGETKRQKRQYARELRREGFVSGYFAVFDRSTESGPVGLSTDIQVGSPGQAASDAKRNREFITHFNSERGDWKGFSVAGIPAARGIRSKSRTTWDVYFSDDVYSYVVAWITPHRTNSRSLVTAAAVELYQRVHGAPVCA
jgi:hypothetical protein